MMPLGPAQHQLYVVDTDGPNKWLECHECPYTALWDGQDLHKLLDGDRTVAHVGSW
jgi:hypothetical protein